MMVKMGLLMLLGFFWAVRLAAIKAAGLAGIPVHVVVAVSALGIACFFTSFAVVRRDWPPLDRKTFGFYMVSGVLGFLAPFAVESMVAPQLPVFVFVVIIATMPIVTLMLSLFVGSERLHLTPVLAVGLGFVGAMVILWDTAQTASLSAPGTAGAWWIVIGFGVPILYAINTVFVATRWPARAGAIHVAHSQALIMAIAAMIGSSAAGVLGEWGSVSLAPLTIALIVAGEGLALLVYLRIARDYGATWVSFANYVSMVFAAIIGAVFFGDQISSLSVFAALMIIASVTFYHRRDAPLIAGDTNV